MLMSELKLSLVNFEYFLLQISHKNDGEHIKVKLASLKEMDGSSSTLILSFADAINFSDIPPIVKKVQDEVNGSQISLFAIIRNQYIKSDEIHGIPVVDMPITQDKTIETRSKSLIIGEPVRSGIRIENNGDIIVTNFVSDNAEVVATGNIHVYGVARGRLIAGHDGDKSARIFVSQFNAELISIAGVYRAIETKLPMNVLNKPVMISLDERNHLNITLF